MLLRLGLGHARVHVGVLVGLAGDRRLEVLAGRADRQPGGRVAHRLEVLEVAVRVTGLAFGGRTEHRGHVVVTLDVGLGGEVEVAAVRLRFAGERGLEVRFGLAALERALVRHDDLCERFSFRQVLNGPRN